MSAENKTTLQLNNYVDMDRLNTMLEGMTDYLLDLEKSNIESNSNYADAPEKARKEHASTLKVLEMLVPSRLAKKMGERYGNYMSTLFHTVLNEELSEMNKQFEDCKKVYRINTDE